MKLSKIIGDVWFNSQPLTSEDLKNKVVLVDFWTYSCVNCQRTLPYLKTWWEKYKDMNLIIIGVHTPEFEFEKNKENVAQALKDFNITWPVVMDNDHINWNNFANKYWPAKYLANKDGKVVYEHFGEGSYKETEDKIQELLSDGNTVLMPKTISEEHTHGKVCFPATPELYCGYWRGKLSDQEYIADEAGEYKKPDRVRINMIALGGKFIAQSEYIEAVEVGSEILLNFQATEVNLVMSPVDETAIVEIRLNSEPLNDDNRGHDVGKNSEVPITKSTLYNLFKSELPVTSILSIIVKKGSFRAYAFTFSGCSG